MPSRPTPRECISILTPYASARRTGPASADVWLNANEGEAWLSEIVLDPSKMNRYPEFQPPEVINAYAAYAGLDPSQVMVTRGADEGIDLIVGAYCEPGHDKVMIAPPTYGMFAIAAETQGVSVASYVRNLGEAIDPSALIERANEIRAKVILLCSPNNPSGETIPIATVEEIANALPASLIVVDEAYIEFAEAGRSILPLIERFTNVVVLRTLSKAFGLAGIRIGFCLASAETISLISKALAPYPIPRPSSAIAAMALTDDAIALMRARVVANNQRRTEVAALLANSPLVKRVLPTEANFITFEAKRPTALLEAFKAKAIAIRDFSGRPGMERMLRVSIGSAEECAAFAKVIKDGLSDG